MGRIGFPLYGDIDLGSTIETAKSLIAKIESNRFGKTELVKLEEVLADIRKVIADNEH